MSETGFLEGFTVGSWVRLRSGGPRMKIESVRVVDGTRYYTCTWRAAYHGGCGVFSEHTVDAIDTPNDERAS